MNHEDLETMSIGMVLDHVDEYLDMKNPDKKQSGMREAGQNDFDAF